MWPVKVMVGTDVKSTIPINLMVPDRYSIANRTCKHGRTFNTARIVTSNLTEWRVTMANKIFYKPKAAPPVEVPPEAITEATEVPPEAPAAAPATSARKKKLVVELPESLHLKLRVYAAAQNKSLTEIVIERLDGLPELLRVA